MKFKLLFVLMLIPLVGCRSDPSIEINIKSPVCIMPFDKYHYLTCNDINFTVNGEDFKIPKKFETDLASIPKIAWPIMAPAHSSLIRPAIVHDFFYRKTCDFNRYETDLIFYNMLKNDGISTFRASIMYYAVRWFGWKYYNEDYCDEKFKGLD